MTRKLEFDAGHRVPLHASKCKTPHGHRYVAEITIRAPSLCEKGFVLDFGVVKQIVGTWIDTYWDHTMIYQKGDACMEAMEAACSDGKPWFSVPFAPTAENLSKFLYEKSCELLDDERIVVERVRLYETPNCWADWSGGIR
jgi:6-pyruvoyltetrahydropterin/6-carboxytetrahydropterin synthase